MTNPQDIDQTFERLRRVPFEQIPYVEILKQMITGKSMHRQFLIGTIPVSVDTIISDIDNVSFIMRILEGTGWSKEDFLQELRRRYGDE